MKKILYLILLIPLLTSLIGCGPSKEDILKDLDDGLKSVTTSSNEIDVLLVETGYLPGDIYFICDEITEYIPINWTSSSKDISLVYGTYSSDGPDYTVFYDKLYTRPYYAIKINKFNDNRTKYNLTAIVNYKNVSLSKTFVLTVGSEKDSYMGNLNNWRVDGDKLKYLKETYSESNGSTQGKPNTTRTTSQAEFDEGTGILHLQYVKKRYIYPSTNKSEAHIFDYNCKTKELTYKENKLDLSKRYTSEDYNSFLNSGIDYKNLTDTGFLKLIKDLDGYFLKFGMEDCISIFAASGEYNYKYLFNIPNE